MEWQESTIAQTEDRLVVEEDKETIRRDKIFEAGSSGCPEKWTLNDKSKVVKQKTYQKNLNHEFPTLRVPKDYQVIWKKC